MFVERSRAPQQQVAKIDAELDTHAYINYIDAMFHNIKQDISNRNVPCAELGDSHAGLRCSLTIQHGRDLGDCILRHTLRVAGILWLSICTGVLPAHGHTIEGLVALDLLGHEAPFGFDETETYTEVWGANELGYLGSLNSGVAIIDVSEPTSPLTISEYGSELEIGFYDVRTAGSVGFFSTKETGTHIVDLSEPSDPVQLARVGMETQGFDSVTNAVVYGDYLYQVSETSSMIAVTDISNPRAPKFTTRLDTQDSVGVYDLTIVDDRLYVAGLGGTQGEGASYIYDITNFPSEDATFLAQIPTGDNSASAWPNSDHSKLIVTQRKAGGGVSTWDISDLNSPAIIDAADASDFGINAFSSGPIFVLDEIAYLAWHQAGAQVLDLELLDQTDTIFRTGAFGTSQASPLSKYAGNMSVHPISHETVLLSDSQWGLYVVDASEAASTTFTIPESDLEATCSDVSAGKQDHDALLEVLGQLGILVGDADQNGGVEFADFLILSRNFGESEVGYAGGDFDCNGEVAFADFLALSSNFGSQTVAAVPEPAGTKLLMLGLWATLLSRTQRAKAEHAHDD